MTDTAEEILRGVLYAARNVWGRRSADRAEALGLLAEVLLARGRREEAEKLAHEALATVRRMRFANHPRVKRAQELLERVQTPA